jgi:hypothetical protein
MTRPDPDSPPDPDPDACTADATAGTRCDPDYDPPYPCRERFDARIAVYEDDRGRVAVIDDPTERDAWLLSTRFTAIER